MARPNKSADKITDALVSLIQCRAYEGISVQDIAEQAGVSRICFYRNFASREQVLERFIDRVVEELEQGVAAMRKPVTLQEYFTVLFGTLRPYGAVVRELVKAKLGGMMMERFNEKLFLTPIAHSALRFGAYERRFFTGAFYNVLTEWAMNGTRESAEEMAAFISRMTSEGRFA